MKMMSSRLARTSPFFFFLVSDAKGGEVNKEGDDLCCNLFYLYSCRGDVSLTPLSILS